VFTHRQFGVVLNGMYQHHGRTSLDYRFGHQLTTQLLLFGETLISENLKLIPNAGLTFEQITTDLHANDQEVIGTGGRGTFASAGLNLKLGNWLLGAAASVPVAQSYSHGAVEANGRLSAQISFTF
jgi:hypothetical protein